MNEEVIRLRKEYDDLERIEAEIFDLFFARKRDKAKEIAEAERRLKIESDKEEERTRGWPKDASEVLIKGGFPNGV